MNVVRFPEIDLNTSRIDALLRDLEDVEVELHSPEYLFLNRYYESLLDAKMYYCLYLKELADE